MMDDEVWPTFEATVAPLRGGIVFGVEGYRGLLHGVYEPMQRETCQVVETTLWDGFRSPEPKTNPQTEACTPLSRQQHTLSQQSHALTCPIPKPHKSKA